MLVLSRRRDERIMIGDDVEITIVDIRGDSVRIGIAAPRSIPVYRKEIYEAIQRENIAAAKTGVDQLEGLKGLFPGAGGGKTPPSTRPQRPGQEKPKEKPKEKPESAADADADSPPSDKV